MRRTLITIALVVLAASAVGVGWVAARGLAAPSTPTLVGTGFTYQGRLTDGGSPASGDYDLQFALYDDATGGAQAGGTIVKEDVAVSDGLFAVLLDFGDGVFTGGGRWLDIAVRAGASTGAFTALSPRQELTPAPYALALPGLYTQPNETSTNLIGGFSGNSVTSGVVGATIGGGGATSTENSVSANYGTVGGGLFNIASGEAATIGGGQINAAGGFATVGGGQNNTASDWNSTVGGGFGNVANRESSAVGGGSGNTASGSYATVSGGGHVPSSGVRVRHPVDRGLCHCLR